MLVVVFFHLLKLVFFHKLKNYPQAPNLKFQLVVAEHLIRLKIKSYLYSLGNIHSVPELDLINLNFESQTIFEFIPARDRTV